MERNGLAGRRKVLQGRPQAFEVVDDALHGQLRRIARRYGGGDVDDAAVGEQAGVPLASTNAGLETHELHGFLRFSGRRRFVLEVVARHAGANTEDVWSVRVVAEIPVARRDVDDDALGIDPVAIAPTLETWRDVARRGLG